MGNSNNTNNLSNLIKANKAKTLNKVIVLYPQQILNDPVTIKKEFDRLRLAYELLDRYQNEKDFYGVPQLWTNKASLGIWMNFGSRYGSSQSRNNNLIPYLVAEKSGGPFEYQHQFVTGVAPLELMTHEEPQSQFLYQFKASYFHLSVMADMNIFLVGNNYYWKNSDLNSLDVKFHDMNLFEQGFDYKNFSIGMGARNLLFGANDGTQFINGSLPLGLLKMVYRNHLFSFEFLSGSGKVEDTDKAKLEGNFSRYNLKVTTFEKWSLQYSFINKQMIFGDFQMGASPFNAIDNLSETHAFFSSYKLNSSYLMSGFTSIEFQKISSQVKNEKRVFPKIGLSISLNF